jgi:hypothetical protein
MPPTPVSSPDRRFVVTRFDNGIESNVIATTPLSSGYTSDQVIRKQTFDNIATYLANNPGIRFRIYGPTNGGDHTDDDCIWDSAINSEVPF